MISPAIIVVVIIIIIGFFFFVLGGEDERSVVAPVSEEQSGAKTVVFTDSGFSPASAMRPTHKVYPGSDIEKCGTAEESKIFDACRAIPAGGSWFFTFNEAGSWDYHDHLDAKNFGKIIVE